GSQGWYPSGITLPNGMVLIYGGDDLDESGGPDTSIQDKDLRDVNFRNTQIFHPIAVVFDPTTGETTALENARKIFPGLYPAATVVETGPGETDWRVCTLGGVAAPISDEDLSIPRSDGVDPAAEWRRFCPPTNPGCAADTRAQKANTGQAGARASSSVDCLDV